MYQDKLKALSVELVKDIKSQKDLSILTPQQIKLIVETAKNDANDALALCETALRPGIHLVAIKTVEQFITPLKSGN